MPLTYEPQDEVPDSYPALKPGDYEFKVDEAEETVFGTGNRGLKVRLLVGYSNGRDVPCFENFAYTEKAAWKLKQFLEALGFDYKKPPEAFDLIGKTGWARFFVSEDGYFKVKNYDPVYAVEKAHVSGPDKPAAKNPDGDNVPF